MSVELSRRLAKVVLFEPIRSLPPGDRKGIADAAEDSDGFSDLRPRYQQMILAAEELRGAATR
ncbi:MAG: hypothetical protein HYX51_06085 [Chloroflexi bacterium]|nr:hypothetical protein [Chloroflexota bacterium]